MVLVNTMAMHFPIRKIAFVNITIPVIHLAFALVFSVDKGTCINVTGARTINTLAVLTVSIDTADFYIALNSRISL